MRQKAKQQAAEEAKLFEHGALESVAMGVTLSASDMLKTHQVKYRPDDAHPYVLQISVARHD